MNVTIDVVNDSRQGWVPDEQSISQWINLAVEESGMDTAAGVSLRVLDEEAAAALNKTYRNRDSATNVLSFPASVPAEINRKLGYRPLGDIVICPQVVAREAAQQHKALTAHWAHLLLHGTLHLLGYHHDDETNANTMEQLEIKVLDRLGIANPYLIG